MSTTTSCTAFLQSHVGRLPSRAGAAINLLQGTRVGAWRIIGPRRAGTRSDTYPIAHARDGVVAAMTVFDAPAVAIASYTRRIFETAQILTALDHPGAASILDAGLVADGRPYVVTEAHRGMSLADRLGDEIVDPIDGLAILRSMCEPLIAAHEMGVVHGALELEHVFLVDFDDSQVKILDWGMERAVHEEARRAGMDIPLRVYPVAPETSLGIISTKIDAYAFGVIAHRLLLGRMPFLAESQVAIRLLQEETLPDPRALWPAIPPMLETLLCELLSNDPRVRPSMRQTAERLDWIARDLAGPKVMFVPASAALEVSSAKPVKPIAEEPPPKVEFKTPFNWRIAAVAVATVASAALAIGVVQRADELATMAAVPKKAPVLEPSPVAETPPVVTNEVPHAKPPMQQPRAPRVTPPPPAVATVVIARAAAPARTRAPVVRPRPAEPDRSSELLAQYQRIGHDLIQLKRAKPSPATNEMWQQFRALKIEPALATAKSRDSAAATLEELRAKIDQQKTADKTAGADKPAISEKCRDNPFADGCG